MEERRLHSSNLPTCLFFGFVLVFVFRLLPLVISAISLKQTRDSRPISLASIALCYRAVLYVY